MKRSINSNIFDQMYDYLFGMVAELQGYYDTDCFEASDEEFTLQMVEVGCFILGFIQYSSGHPNIRLCYDLGD